MIVKLGNYDPVALGQKVARDSLAQALARPTHVRLVPPWDRTDADDDTEGEAS